MNNEIYSNGGECNKTRRSLMKAMFCAPLITAGLPQIASASIAQSKFLTFQNTHTGEKLALTYFEQGRYINDALSEVNFVLRDHRTDEVHQIDTSLLDLLYDLHTFLGAKQPFQIISGYRSPTSNALLNKTTTGVAKKSLHMLGKAIDIRLADVDTRLIREAAITLRRGGVGYYQDSDFVHVDTGRVRAW